MIAILGAGKMGEALLSGVLRAGRRPSDLIVTARREERGALLRERYGVEVATNAEAARPPTRSSWRSSRRTWARCWTS